MQNLLIKIVNFLIKYKINGITGHYAMPSKDA